MSGYEGMRVYVSGPMTGMPGWNREAFREAAKYLRAQGAAHVFNPAFGAGEGAPRPHSEWMLRDLHELTDHMDGRPFYDVLAQIDGWERSRGAQVERVVALACGLEVVRL